jgi:hypothetical protein
MDWVVHPLVASLVRWSTIVTYDLITQFLAVGVDQIRYDVQHIQLKMNLMVRHANYQNEIIYAIDHDLLPILIKMQVLLD